MRRQSTFCWWGVYLVVLVSVTQWVGCASSTAGGQNAAYSNSANAGGAALTAVAAGVIWAAGGGCRLQGCPYGSFCNQESGFCDVRRCAQGCPADTICNEGLNRCQARPPPRIPSDRLPQDDKISNPPTVH
jgi:hypothetical protein